MVTWSPGRELRPPFDLLNLKILGRHFTLNVMLFVGLFNSGELRAPLELISGPRDLMNYDVDESPPFTAR